MNAQQIASIKLQVREAYKAAALARPGRQSKKPWPYSVLPEGHEVVRRMRELTGAR